jgi:hypothetical protein
VTTAKSKVTTTDGKSGIHLFACTGKNGTKRQIWMWGDAYYLGKD